MTTLTTPTAERSRDAARLRSWQTAAGLTTIAAGAAIVTGALLPWVETFAGLIGIPGIRGINGRILAAVGILIAAAGIWHLVRGGQAARWLIGIAGCGALGFSAYLLIQLTRSMSVRIAPGQAGSGMIRIGVVVGVSVPPAGSTVTPSWYPRTRPDARTGVVWPFSGLLSRPDGLATDLPSSHSS